MKLTKTTVEAVQPGERDSFVCDDRLAGFGLKVTPKGRRSYVVQYRPRGRTQTKRITLGVHGQPWTADKAREAAEHLLLRVRNGEDPVETARAERAAADAAAHTDREQRFEVVLESFVQLYAKPKNRRWEDTRRVIAFDALPIWRDRPVGTIHRRDLVQLMDQVSTRSPSAARALYAQLRRMFAWCVERGLIEQSPCLGMRAPPPVESRDRWLNDDEIRLFWHALGGAGGPFESLFKLLLLTGQRREEVTGMRWSELNLSRAEWVLPKARSKNNKEHAIDLSPAALAILLQQPRTHQLVFTTTGVTPLSNHAKYRQRLLARMRALRLEEAEALGEPPAPISDWTVHDLRRTAATGMAKLRYPPHVIEAGRNHRGGPRGGLVAVYQHYDHRDERRSALHAWGKHVVKLVESTCCPSVITSTASF